MEAKNMGTRGILGIRKGKNDKMTYNHFDSYPIGLGVSVCKEIKKLGIEKISEGFDKIKMVTEKDMPTPEQIKNLKKFTDLHVSEQSTSDWYCLLRNAQGSIKAYIQAGYMSDGHEFIRDSLFCEWGYIVNLDEGTLEIYKGFQKQKPIKSRYTEKLKGEKYYPCELIRTVSLKEVISMSEEEIKGYMEKLEKREEMKTWQ